MASVGGICFCLLHFGPGLMTNDLPLIVLNFGVGDVTSVMSLLLLSRVSLAFSSPGGVILHSTLLDLVLSSTMIQLGTGLTSISGLLGILLAFCGESTICSSTCIAFSNSELCTSGGFGESIISIVSSIVTMSRVVIRGSTLLLVTSEPVKSIKSTGVVRFG